MGRFVNTSDFGAVFAADFYCRDRPSFLEIKEGRLLRTVIDSFLPVANHDEKRRAEVFTPLPFCCQDRHHRQTTRLPFWDWVRSDFYDLRRDGDKPAPVIVNQSQFRTHRELRADTAGAASACSFELLERRAPCVTDRSLLALSTQAMLPRATLRVLHVAPSTQQPPLAVAFLVASCSTERECFAVASVSLDGHSIVVDIIDAHTWCPVGEAMVAYSASEPVPRNFIDSTSVRLVAGTDYVAVTFDIFDDDREERSFFSVIDVRRRTASLVSSRDMGWQCSCFLFPSQLLLYGHECLNPANGNVMGELSFGRQLDVASIPGLHGSFASASRCTFQLHEIDSLSKESFALCCSCGFPPTTQIAWTSGPLSSRRAGHRMAFLHGATSLTCGGLQRCQASDAHRPARRFGKHSFIA